MLIRIVYLGPDRSLFQFVSETKSNIHAKNVSVMQKLNINIILPMNMMKANNYVIVSFSLCGVTTEIKY